MPDKEHEHWYLAQLQRAMPDFPRGKVEPGESPDFIVRCDEHNIGIEVTAFHLPPMAGKPHQEVQSLKERVVNLACQSHANAGGPALYVTVFFRDASSITKANCGDIAHALASVVLSAPVPASFNDGKTYLHDHLPPCIVVVSIHASIDGTDRLWSADAGGWVARALPSHIESEIERKRAMSSVAKAKCDQVWLLIVNDIFSKAAPVELSAEAQGRCYMHPFDRLLWLQPHGPRVYELKSALEPLT